MCATSDGHSESVRRRSQPNHRPSGRTRMACAGSTWAAANRSELTIQAATFPSGRPPSHRAGRGTPASSTSGASTAITSEARHEQRGRAGDVQRLLHALRLDAELADRDRHDQGAHRAQHDRPEAGRPHAQGRQAPASPAGRPPRPAPPGRTEEDGRASPAFPRSRSSQTAGTSNSGRTARKITIDHPRIGRKSFWINGLASAAKPFDSSPGRPYTPAVQSVVPI